MASLDDLSNIVSPPAGWETGLKWEGDMGEITTGPLESAPTPSQWDHVLEKFGLDPRHYAIEGKVRHSAWEVPGHGVQHAYRANVVERPASRLDVEDLLDQIYINPPSDIAPVSDETLTIVLTDTHIGKGENDGGGTPRIIDTWKRGVSAALQKRGNVKHLNLVFGGDLIEGYTSQNGRNIIGCDLTLSEQIRLAQHMVSWTIQECLVHFEDIHVSAVPGNHGETTRVQGVPMGDSFDIMIVKNVQQAIMLTPARARVTFHYPPEQYGSTTYTVGGNTYTVVHGHKFRSQLKGAQDWWAGHIANDRPESKSTILIAGHYHSALWANWTRNRWIIFCSALEIESTWFANQTGATSQKGVTTFLAKDGKPYGFEIM